MLTEILPQKHPAKDILVHTVNPIDMVELTEEQSMKFFNRFSFSAFDKIERVEDNSIKKVAVTLQGLRVVLDCDIEKRWAKWCVVNRPLDQKAFYFVSYGTNPVSLRSRYQSGIVAIYRTKEAALAEQNDIKMKEVWNGVELDIREALVSDFDLAVGRVEWKFFRDLTK